MDHKKDLLSQLPFAAKARLTLLGAARVCSPTLPFALMCALTFPALLAWARHLGWSVGAVTATDLEVIGGINIVFGLALLLGPRLIRERFPSLATTLATFACCIAAGASLLAALPHAELDRAAAESALGEASGERQALAAAARSARPADREALARIGGKLEALNKAAAGKRSGPNAVIILFLGLLCCIGAPLLGILADNALRASERIRRLARPRTQLRLARRRRGRRKAAGLRPAWIAILLAPAKALAIAGRAALDAARIARDAIADHAILDEADWTRIERRCIAMPAKAAAAPSRPRRI